MRCRRRAFSCWRPSISLCSCMSSTRFCCQTERPCLPLTTCQVSRSASTTASTLPAGRHTRAAASTIRSENEGGGGTLRPPLAVLCSCRFPSCMCPGFSLPHHKLLGRGAQRLHVLFAAGLGVSPHDGLGSRQ